MSPAKGARMVRGLDRAGPARSPTHQPDTSVLDPSGPGRRRAFHNEEDNDMKTLMMVGAFAVALSVSAAAGAAEFEVKMLNRGEAGVMVFEPAYLEIAAGDSVRFVPVDQGHNAETIPGMLPEGAEPFKGRFNEEITVTFDIEGAYGYKCLPHFAMGMVGLIVVGENPANLDAIAEVRLPQKARERFDPWVEQARQ